MTVGSNDGGRSRWSADPDPVSYIRSSTTFVLAFNQDGRELILRLQHSSDSTEVRILSELSYLRHVAESGVQVALPVESIAGRALEIVDWRDHTFFAAAFEYIPGNNTAIDELSKVMISNWGETAARIHSASQSFQAPDGFSLPTWYSELDALADFVPDSDSRVKQELDDVRHWLEQRVLNEDTFGLIHRDLELDNMKWDGHQFVVYDFNDAMHHFFAADVASALEEPLESERAEEYRDGFLEGYSKVRDLTDINLEEFPRFYRAARLRQYLRLLAAYSNSDPDTDPDWLSGMRKYHDGLLAKLHESIQTPFHWS